MISPKSSSGPVVQRGGWRSQTRQSLPRLCQRHRKPFHVPAVNKRISEAKLQLIAREIVDPTFKLAPPVFEFASELWNRAAPITNDAARSWEQPR